jgi:hypothetical protein
MHMNKILYLAETGAGKTSSLRNLDPKKTAIVNIDKKALPLRGWRTNYVTVRTAAGKVDFSESNYIEAESPGTVLKILQSWETQPWVETIVIDTITHMITYDYMTNAIGKDFKAYQAMGKNFYEIIEFVRDSKKNVIVMGHIKKQINDMGDVVYEMKAQGKMISDLVPPSYFTTVLVGEIHRTKGEKPKYVVRTQSEGNDPAKSPAAFDAAGEAETALELYEPNDIALILGKLDKFETL